MTSLSLSHYTLNTGHSRMSPRSEVREETIRFLDPVLANRGGWIPGMDSDFGFALTIGSGEDMRLVQLIYCRREAARTTPPFALFAAAWSDDAASEAWGALTRIAAKFGLPTTGNMPAELPALLVLLLPPAAKLAPGVLMAAADLERCIAWAILAQEGLAH